MSWTRFEGSRLFTRAKLPELLLDCRSHKLTYRQATPKTLASNDIQAKKIIKLQTSVPSNNGREHPRFPCIFWLKSRGQQLCQHGLVEVSVAKKGTFSQPAWKESNADCNAELRSTLFRERYEVPAVLKLFSSRAGVTSTRQL